MYTVKIKEEVLEMMEPDDLVILEESEPPDPVAAEPDVPTSADLPQLCSNRSLSRKLKKLIGKHKDVFAIKSPATPAKLNPFRFNIDGTRWEANIRPKQYTRPLSHDKDVTLEEWINSALESDIISKAPV
jgi:hypothetical protein